jgi:hypothetical protein
MSITQGQTKNLVMKIQLERQKLLEHTLLAVKLFQQTPEGQGRGYCY